METSEEVFGDEWCRRRRVPSIHMVNMLQARELGNRKSGTHFFNGARQFYQCIHPNKSTPDIDRKNLIPKRFTPDGRFLICLLADLQGICVRSYAGMFGLADCPETDMFEVVFPESYSINICHRFPEGTTMNKDCFFVTSDSRFLIVANEYQLSEASLTISQVYSSNESLIVMDTPYYDSITFFSIELESGVTCDTYNLPADRVWVSHGVHLVGRLLAVFSLHHQTIHFFHIGDDGHFVTISQVGRFLFDDDSYVVFSGGHPVCNLPEPALTALKQRLMTFVWQQCCSNKNEFQFFNTFDHLRSLRIWQMQLVGTDIVLLRWVHQDAFASNTTINTQPTVFIFFNWRTGQILGMFDRRSEYFLKLVESCQEELKHAHILDNRFPTTMQHCQAAYFHHERLKCALTSAKGGSTEETMRRILCQLPYSTTYVSTESPYLDPSMFNYDEKLLVAVERMKIPGTEILRFFSRVTLQFLFDLRIDAARYVHLLFHPTEPFAMSFDRTRPLSPVTFHMPHTVTSRY